MEAFTIIHHITQQNGTCRTIFSKAFAATGWEAEAKTRRNIEARTPNIKKLKFVDWNVLNPFKAHFKLFN